MDKSLKSQLEEGLFLLNLSLKQNSYEDMRELVQKSGKKIEGALEALENIESEKNVSNSLTEEELRVQNTFILMVLKKIQKLLLKSEEESISLKEWLGIYNLYCKLIALNNEEIDYYDLGSKLLTLKVLLNTDLEEKIYNKQATRIKLFLIEYKRIKDENIKNRRILASQVLDLVSSKK